MTNLTTLRLEHNDLETLPDGIFEELTNLTTLTLSGNPGSATFLPVAVAGPQGGIDAAPGEEEVKLGGDAGGPWGNNLIYSWRKVTETAQDLSQTDIQEPTVTAPGPGEAVEYELTVTAKGTSLTATDSVAVRVAAPPVAAAVTEVALSSTPIADSTYKLGETIQAVVGFSKPVSVTGTPQLALSVGTQTLQANYVQGTGTGPRRRLVFEYTVQSTDADLDGIEIAANRLALNGGAVEGANGTQAVLTHDALGVQSGHKVDGSSQALTGGICGRTPQVRDKLVELVKAKPGNSAIANCSLVTTTHLPTLTGTLDLSRRGHRDRLKPGDFADLGGLGEVWLSNNDLTALPAGMFEGLPNTLTWLALNLQRSADDPGQRFRRTDRPDNAPAGRQRPLVAAAAHLREADRCHEPDVERNNPGSARSQTDREGWPGERVQGGPGRERHSRGRGRGERLRRPLGEQRRACLDAGPRGYDRDV